VSLDDKQTELIFRQGHSQATGKLRMPQELLLPYGLYPLCEMGVNKNHQKSTTKALSNIWHGPIDALSASLNRVVSLLYRTATVTGHGTPFLQPTVQPKTVPQAYNKLGDD
jgi:hypothetical protein